MCKMFDVTGRVIPVTLEDVHLAVRFEDGTVIEGEKNIDVSDKNPGERTHNIDQNIEDAWLIGAEGNLNPRAREAIMNADYIIIGPGDLYTSVIPNLLSKGMREALDATPAKLIYVCNAMTKRGETTNMEVKDFIEAIEERIQALMEMPELGYPMELAFKQYKFALNRNISMLEESGFVQEEATVREKLEHAENGDYLF